MSIEILRLPVVGEQNMLIGVDPERERGKYSRPSPFRFNLYISLIRTLATMTQVRGAKASTAWIGYLSAKFEEAIIQVR
jgi:hypothetical protein